MVKNAAFCPSKRRKRGTKVPLFLYGGADGNLPRPARLPRRKRRVSVLSPIRAFASLDMIADFIVLAMLFVFGLRERVQIATRKI